MALHGVTLGRLEGSDGVEREEVGRLFAAHCVCHGVSRRSREAGSQLVEGDSNPPLDGAERHLHRGGDLGLRVAAVVGELDRLPLLDGKLGERLADLLAAQLERNGRPRVADRRLDRLTLDGSVEPGAVAITAQTVDRAVADDRADP